jgi:hypothetical protein
MRKVERDSYILPLLQGERQLLPIYEREREREIRKGMDIINILGKAGKYAI